MVSDLELVSTEELIDELIKRHDDLIVIRQRDNGPDKSTCKVHICAVSTENDAELYARSIRLCNHGVDTIIDMWQDDSEHPYDPP